MTPCWYVKDFADGWIKFYDVDCAIEEAKTTGAIMQYSHNGAYPFCAELQTSARSAAPSRKDPPSKASDMSELLPCPFCSGKAILDYYPGEGDHTIHCQNRDSCNVKMEAYGHKQHVIEAWNRRRDPSKPIYKYVQVLRRADLKRPVCVESVEGLAEAINAFYEGEEDYDQRCAVLKAASLWLALQEQKGDRG